MSTVSPRGGNYTDEDSNLGNSATRMRHTATEEAPVAATGPASWWRYGLVALALVVAILLGMQLLSGNKGTDVIPGTPVAAPQNNVPVPVSQ